MTIIYFLQKKRNKHKFYIFSGRVNYAPVRDGALLAVIIGFLPVFGYLQLHSLGHVHAYYRQGTSCTRTNATKSVHKLHASLSIICIRRLHYIARVSVTQTYTYVCATSCFFIWKTLRCCEISLGHVGGNARARQQSRNKHRDSRSTTIRNFAQTKEDLQGFHSRSAECVDVDTSLHLKRINKELTDPTQCNLGPLSFPHWINSGIYNIIFLLVIGHLACAIFRPTLSWTRWSSKIRFFCSKKLNLYFLFLIPLF